MTEREKCDAGHLYDTGFPEREPAHIRCADLCFAYNHTLPSNMARRTELITELFGKVGKEPYVEPNIFCGFGFNIEVGDNFFANNNCVFVDPGKITFGNHVYIGPNCGFYTACHPIDAKLRNDGFEFAQPIKVGDDVWMGGGTTVLPGVTIGSNVVIGAGSVITKDIPSNVVAYGNPCKAQRPITEADRQRDASR